MQVALSSANNAIKLQLHIHFTLSCQVAGQSNPREILARDTPAPTLQEDRKPSLEQEKKYA
jgi:hypothetical protein